jgi:hypothetical protein
MSEVVEIRGQTFFDIGAGAVCTRAQPSRAQPRKDKGVAILDYALGNRPSTGEGGRWAAGCVPNAPGRQLVPAIGRRKRGVARSGSHLPGRAL